MILKFEHFAHKLDRMVTVHMYLPNDYMDSKQDYPVLYMFDGHNLFYDEDATFGTSWNLIPFLDSLEHPMIVVGLECNHEGNKRINEYSPCSFYDPEMDCYFEGKAYQTMDFILHELKPMIDHRFPTRTDRKHTWIGGASCGATIALYGLYHYSYAFSKAICLSPYLVPLYTDVMKQIYRSRIITPSHVYLSWGTNEGHGAHEFVAETKCITDLSNLLLKKHVRLHFNVKLYGRHCEQDWHAEADSFLRYLSYD